DAIVDITRHHAVLHHAADRSSGGTVGVDAEPIVIDPGAVDGDVGRNARGRLYGDSGGESAASVIGDMAVRDEELGCTGRSEPNAKAGAAPVVDLHFLDVQHSGTGKIDQAERATGRKAVPIEIQTSQCDNVG